MLVTNTSFIAVTYYMQNKQGPTVEVLEYSIFLLNIGNYIQYLVITYNRKESEKEYPECSLEELMLKLKFHCFGLLMQRDDSLAKTLLTGEDTDAGKD